MSSRSPEWSVPETELFAEIRAALESERDAVLATVVDVEGSAYRRPGAKMLVDPHGGGAGSITAGCLEDEVRALAADVLEAGEPRVETWDLTGDDDVWGMGVGCNGVVTVLLEPLGESFRSVAAALERGENVGVVTVLGGDLPVGSRSVYRPGAGFEGGTLPGWLRDELTDVVEEFVEEGSSGTIRVGGATGAVDVGTIDAGTNDPDTNDPGTNDTDADDRDTVDVFVDGVRAPPELVVFGSGHDVRPVVELAKRVDFRVTVVAFRGGRADADRFQRADDVVSASPREVGALRAWDDDSYAIVMTHNFVDDRLTVRELLETDVAYVGLMGPDERFEEMLADFEEDGVTLSAADRERIFTPIGLDLGGGTPHQIGFSVVAELLAVANDRTPQHLSRRAGPIHDRRDEDSE